MTSPSENIQVKRPKFSDYQTEILYSPKRFTVTEASTKSGKAQPLTAIIKTPKGDKLMGDIAPGDAVFTECGISVVNEIYRQGITPVYEVTFSDRSKTRCTADHLWEVHRLGRRNKHSPRKRRDCKVWPQVLPLSYLMDGSKNELRHYSIARCHPVEFPHKKTRIDPYLMGVILGDGCVTGGGVTIASGDSEILNLISGVLPINHEIIHASKYDYRIAVKGSATQAAWDKSTIASKLRHYGVMGRKSNEKCVPKDYIYNSSSVRKEVLRGLLDTDGFVGAHGEIMIEITSKELANNIREIVQSLGGMVKSNFRKVNGYKKDGVFIKCLPVYRLNILIENPKDYFKLDRKKNLCKERKKPIRRNFKSIEFVGYEETQCISVDNPSGLYLTDEYIVTHNTFSHLFWLFELAHGENKDWYYQDIKDGMEFWWVAPIFTQSEIAFNRIKRKIESTGSYRINHSKLSITTPLGSVIRFKSADKPDSLYGEDVYGAVFDEFTRAKEEAWHALRSTLTHTKGPCKFIGNYTGSTNWGHKLRVKAKNSESEYAVFTVDAFKAVEAGILDATEIEQARKDLPKVVFDALYLAKGSISGDILFPPEKVFDLFTNTFVKETGERYMSADIATYGSDRFVLGVWHGLVLKKIYVIDKCEANEVEAFLKEKAEEHRIPRSNIVYDADGIGSFLRGYLKDAKPFNNGAAPIVEVRKDALNYKNLKAQCFYKLSKMVADGAIYIEDSDYREDIERELEVVVRDDPDGDGKLRILPKDDQKKILGYSPDVAEMIMMRMVYELRPERHRGPVRFNY